MVSGEIGRGFAAGQRNLKGLLRTTEVQGQCATDTRNTAVSC